MIDSCSIVIRKALSSEPSVLGIRTGWAILSNTSFDVKIIALGKGLYSLLEKNGYTKDLYQKFIEAEGEVLVSLEDMHKFGLKKEMFPDGVQFASNEKIAEAIEETASVMTF